jgi:molybdopterin molybdotransferase
MRQALITPSEATLRIMRHPLETRVVSYPLMQSLQRVTASDWISDRHQPPFDRVMMDGIAICFDTYANGQRSWHLKGMHAAGEPSNKAFSTIDAYEIMTGACMLGGYDTVIPYEHVDIKNGLAELKDHPVKCGQNIHVLGSDANQGQVLLKADAIIGPAEIGIAASIGLEYVEVWELPKIKILATGSELVGVSDMPAPHQIRMSNGWALASACKAVGCDMPEVQLVLDDPDALTSAIQQALSSCDVLIVSGGVSMGKLDYVPACLEKCGVEIIFHGIAQRPGKPMLFGSTSNCKVFGLPGNPISAMVCWSRYVRPFLLRNKREQHWPLQVDINKSPLTRFLPVVANAQGLQICPTNGSGDFASLAGCSGFIESSPLNDSDVLPYWPLV